MEMDGPHLKPYGPIAAEMSRLGGVVSLSVGSEDNLWITGNKAVLNVSHGIKTWYGVPSHGDVSEVETPDSHGAVITTYADSEKRFWISTEDGLFNVEDGSVQQCHADDKQLDIPIDSIIEDGTGSIWFGHRGGGLTRFAHGEYRTITRRDGLPSNTISQMCIDDADNIWCGTPKEIFRVSFKELNAFIDSHTPFHAYTYGPADGDSAGSCLAGAQIPMLPSVAGRYSCVWFPCQFGVVRISSTTNAGNPCPVVFERVTFDGRPAATSDSPVVKPGDGNVAFRFTALDLNDPEHLQFSYRLDGFDHSWIDAGQLRQAIYTNLPPGTYRFDLKCVNVDGGWSAERSFKFTLQPHVYQTWWFKILLSLAIVGVAFAYARARISALQERNRVLLDLQKQLEAQNDELFANHSELEAQNEELSELQAELEAQNSELTESKAALEVVNTRLQALATTDGLTGLTNHRTFQDDLRYAWDDARQTGHPLSMLLIDVDHFKLFNDEYGHQAGDQVLIKVGEALKLAARTGDIVARYGGEEFAVLLKDTNASNAMVVAERFRQSIQQNVWGERVITASVGVSTIRPEMETTSALIEAADVALYSSKRRGRNCVTHADDETPVSVSSSIRAA
jgi:diguanylate cyclase (GGDEF)-like protein